MTDRRALPALLPLAALTVALAAPAVAAPGDPQPLTPQQRKLFYKTAEDVLDKKPCVGFRKRVMLHCRDTRHYVRMNEWWHHVWRPYVKNIGGGYVGIASDQNFTFIAWARSELAWLLDYDPVVVHVNLIHRALIRAAKDRAAYLKFWQRKGIRAGRAVLKKEYRSRADLRMILRVYRRYWREIGGTFKQIKRLRRRKSHWLHAESDYQYIRKMQLTDRIRVMKGDLLKNKTLIGVGASARKLKVPVRAIYLSNAEEFWPYPKNFRQNFIKMPMDAKSVVLRTRHTSKYGPRIGSYVYIVQGGQDFQKRLKDPKTKGLWVMMRARRAGRPGFFTIGIPVRPESKVGGRRAAHRRKKGRAKKGR